MEGIVLFFLFVLLFIQINSPLFSLSLLRSLVIGSQLLYAHMHTHTNSKFVAINACVTEVAIVTLRSLIQE